MRKSRSRQLERRLRRQRRAAADGLAGDGESSEGSESFYIQPVGQSPSAGGPTVPDVLHATPEVWGDLAGARELVRFAFEGGDCAGVFDTLVEATPLSPSNFEPEAFAPQLYLVDLLEACFPVQIDSKRYSRCDSLLLRVVSAPPRSADVALARQRVLGELLERPKLRRDLEHAYLAMRRLRDALETGSVAEPNGVRRKLSVLVALKDCVAALADGFEGTDSVLSRLRQLGASIRSRDSHARLLSLLDYDQHMATVDVQLRLGSDGTIRDFGVLAIRDNTDNPLHRGPVRRWIDRVLSFLRGHRYGEQEVVVRLLHEVFEPFVDDVVACLALTGALEVYLACLGFREVAQSKGLAVCLPELVEPPPLGASESAERILEGVFNPLLMLQGIVPRPCDVSVRAHDALVVLTGPNSGGKTRLLQALALVQCLGQAGLFVPAAKAQLVRAPGLFVSLVIESDAAQVEGRLGTELLRIRRLFEKLEPGTLAILDELCSGTNPMEGEAIFEMVVSLLPRLRPQVFVSTHFLSLAGRLERERPVEQLAFLAVELDSEERPTYRFVPGVAETSLAHKVAARLGVTHEELVALVEAKASSPAGRF